MLTKRGLVPQTAGTTAVKNTIIVSAAQQTRTQRYPPVAWGPPAGKLRVRARLQQQQYCSTH